MWGTLRLHKQKIDLGIYKITHLLHKQKTEASIYDKTTHNINL